MDGSHFSSPDAGIGSQVASKSLKQEVYWLIREAGLLLLARVAVIVYRLVHLEPSIPGFLGER